MGGRVVVVVEVGLGYLLIGFRYGVSSSFYLVLLLPVISGATNFGLLGTAVTSLAACAVYLSFLIFLGENQFIPEDQIPELVLRALFLPVVGYLTYQLARANQAEKHRAQQAVEELARANRSLQEAQAEVRPPEPFTALRRLT